MEAGTGTAWKPGPHPSTVYGIDGVEGVEG